MPESTKLLAGKVVVSLGSRAAEILAVLLQEPSALVTKDALMDAVWPGVMVEANNLTVQIAALRRVLDSGVASPSYIQTVPGRGYRLLCQVDAVEAPAGPAESAITIAPDPAPVIAPAPSLVQRRRLAIEGRSWPSCCSPS